MDIKKILILIVVVVLAFLIYTNYFPVTGMFYGTYVPRDGILACGEPFGDCYLPEGWAGPIPQNTCGENELCCMTDNQDWTCLEDWCGNQICDILETIDNCWEDCNPTGPYCGDGVCGYLESNDNCAEDCDEGELQCVGRYVFSQDFNEYTTKGGPEDEGAEFSSPDGPSQLIFYTGDTNEVPEKTILSYNYQYYAESEGEKRDGEFRIYVGDQLVHTHSFQEPQMEWSTEPHEVEINPDRLDTIRITYKNGDYRLKIKDIKVIADNYVSTTLELSTMSDSTGALFIGDDITHFSIPVSSEVEKLNLGESFDEIWRAPICFDQQVSSILVSGQGELLEPEGFARVIAIDEDGYEWVAFASDSLVLEDNFAFHDVCEETCNLEGKKIIGIYVELAGATINIDTVSIHKTEDANLPSAQLYHEGQEDVKIENWNNIIQEHEMEWVAGESGVSELYYHEKKDLYDTLILPNLQGFEYYYDGVYEFMFLEEGEYYAEESSPTTRGGIYSSLPEKWDWTDTHGKNWVTPARDQKSGPTCYAFTEIGAIEAGVNLYYNQDLDLDLSEQMFIDCRDDIVTKRDKTSIIRWLSGGDLSETEHEESSFNHHIDYANIAGISNEFRQKMIKFYSDYGISNSPFTIPKLTDPGAMSSGISIRVDGAMKQVISSVERIPGSYKHGTVFVDESCYDYEEDVKRFKCKDNRICDDWEDRIWKIYGISKHNITGSDNIRSIDSLSSSLRADRELIASKIKKDLIRYGPLYLGTKNWKYKASSGIIPLFLMPKVTVESHSLLLVGYRDTVDGVVWKFKNSWGKNTGKDGFLEIKIKENNINKYFTNVERALVEIVEPPTDVSYWPDGFVNEIQCADADNDGYCWWGLTENKPDTCPSSCKLARDCDDLDDMVGPFHPKTYECQRIGSVICGDDVCDSIESCDSCSIDCGSCTSGESCRKDGDCSSGFCVHGICRPEQTFCGDGYCDTYYNFHTNMINGVIHGGMTVETVTENMPPGCPMDCPCTNGDTNLMGDECRSIPKEYCTIAGCEYDVNTGRCAADLTRVDSTFRHAKCDEASYEEKCLAFGCDWSGSGIVTKIDGVECSENVECASGFCVHDTCRPEEPFCGDNVCDVNEACPNDCKELFVIGSGTRTNLDSDEYGSITVYGFNNAGALNALYNVDPIDGDSRTYGFGVGNIFGPINEQVVLHNYVDDGERDFALLYLQYSEELNRYMYPYKSIEVTNRPRGDFLPTGDFDSDGRDEFVVGSGEPGGDTYGSISIYGSDSITVFKEHDYDIDPITGDNDRYGFGTGDLTGDGAEDIIFHNFEDEGDDDFAVVFWDGERYSWVKADFADGDPTGEFIPTGDFDGDGQVEFALGGRKSGEGRTVTIGNCHDKVCTKETDIVLHDLERGSNYGFGVGDVTGDGLDDIIVHTFEDSHDKDDFAVIYYSGGEWKYMSLEVADGSPKSDFIPTGDFDGDGKIEFALGFDNPSMIVVVTCTTAGCYEEYEIDPIACDSGRYGFGVGDVTGDGLDDIVAHNYCESDIGMDVAVIFWAGTDWKFETSNTPWVPRGDFIPVGSLR